MIIQTNQPVILNQKKVALRVSKFWDQISEGWQEVYGKHIHHGYYENNQPISHKAAQDKLLIKISDLLNISNEASILDVGCGIGGSSFYLAEKYHANVTGITLSKKQVKMAEIEAHKLNIKNILFKVEDALSLSSIPDQTFDIIWSLESCEQFYDKALFISQAYRVLKPGGKLMLATWCSSHSEFEGLLANKYRKLCLAFDVPYMPTIEYYYAILSKHHFILNTVLDWSLHVKKSWEVGLSLINTYSFLRLLKLGGLRGLRFAKQIKLMRDAFQEDYIKYGVFIATKEK